MPISSLCLAHAPQVPTANGAIIINDNHKKWLAAPECVLLKNALTGITSANKRELVLHFSMMNFANPVSTCMAGGQHGGQAGACMHARVGRRAGRACMHCMHAMCAANQKHDGTRVPRSTPALLPPSYARCLLPAEPHHTDRPGLERAGPGCPALERGEELSPG